MEFWKYFLFVLKKSWCDVMWSINFFSEPQTGFRIAFNMFDTDGNQRVDKNEFLVVSTSSGLLQPNKHRCCVSDGVAGAADSSQSWIVSLQGLETSCLSIWSGAGYPHCSRLHFLVGTYSCEWHTWNPVHCEMTSYSSVITNQIFGAGYFSSGKRSTHMP
jgi:hypothetical protein